MRNFEHYLIASVHQHRIENHLSKFAAVVKELARILVGKGQMEAKTAGLRETLCDGGAYEILKLINVDVARSDLTLFAFAATFGRCP